VAAFKTLGVALAGRARETNHKQPLPDNTVFAILNITLCSETPWEWCLAGAFNMVGQ
jgi:hypothetical protein